MNRNVRGEGADSEFMVISCLKIIKLMHSIFPGTDARRFICYVQSTELHRQGALLPLCKKGNRGAGNWVTLPNATCRKWRDVLHAQVTHRLGHILASLRIGPVKLR